MPPQASTVVPAVTTLMELILALNALLLVHLAKKLQETVSSVLSRATAAPCRMYTMVLVNASSVPLCVPPASVTKTISACNVPHQVSTAVLTVTTSMELMPALHAVLHATPAKR